MVAELSERGYRVAGQVAEILRGPLPPDLRRGPPVGYGRDLYSCGHVTDIIGDLIEAGVHALFVGGSAGEGSLLGGAIGTSTRRVKGKIKILANVGFKHFVLTPTNYYTPQTPGEHLKLLPNAPTPARA